MTPLAPDLDNLAALARPSGAFLGYTAAGYPPATVWAIIQAELTQPEWSDWLSAQSANPEVQAVTNVASIAWSILGYPPPWKMPLSPQLSPSHSLTPTGGQPSTANAATPGQSPKQPAGCTPR